MKINHMDKAIAALNADDELSFKIFNGWIITDHPELSLQGKVIYASSFQQEIPDSEIFPKDLVCTFVKCDLSNVRVPVGCVLLECVQTRFKVQNDLRDWEIDINDQPIRVLSEKYWEIQKVSTDPKDIPVQKVVIPVGKTIEEVLKEVLPSVIEVKL